MVIFGRVKLISMRLQTQDKVDIDSAIKAETCILFEKVEFTTKY